jgi:hypothetical protein
MKQTWKTIVAAAILAVLGLPGSARATSIPIVNAGFENPNVAGATYDNATGWVLSAPGNGGVWDLGSNLGGCPGICWDETAPEGNQIGWLSVGPVPGTAASLSQVLGAVLLDNRTYTLTGFVGHPNNFLTNYTVALIAGSTVVASTSGSGPEGEFDPFMLTYSSGLGNPYAGQTLQIRLSSSGAQTGFDAIALSVPDGGLTLTLLGSALLGLGVLRRRLSR